MTDTRRPPARNREEPKSKKTPDDMAPPIDLEEAKKQLRDTERPRIKIPPKPRPTSRASKKSLEKELGEMFAAMGMAAMLVDSYCAMVFIEKAPELAAELNKVAMRNASLYSVLERLVETSVWAGLGGVAVSIVVPILAHHGVLPGFAATLVGAEEPPERPKKEKKRKAKEAESTVPNPTDDAVTILQEHAKRMNEHPANDKIGAPGPAVTPLTPRPKNG